MTFEEAEKHIRDYCKDHQLILFYPDGNPGKNEGGSCCRRIWIGPCDDAERLIMIFCHELGHIQAIRHKQRNNFCSYTNEFEAWNYGIANMERIFGLKLRKKHADWIHGYLDSYRNSPSDRFWHDGDPS